MAGRLLALLLLSVVISCGHSKLALRLDPEVDYNAVSAGSATLTKSNADLPPYPLPLFLPYPPIQLITSKGYPAEAHWATTPDGYILGLHRIPGPRPSQGIYTYTPANRSF